MAKFTQNDGDTALKSLKGIKVDLRSPDGSVYIAKNVTLLTAIKKMQEWLKERGLLC